MDYQKIILETYTKINKVSDLGSKADYIPELANVNSDFFGVHISALDGMKYGVGNYNDKFSIQSISKVLSLALAYSILGEKIWERVGVEPSGTSFNSLVQLEADAGIPRNPFVNAGAIVISDILITHLKNPKADFLTYAKSLSNNQSIKYSPIIAESEKAVGFRNIALCNFIKSLGNLENDPEEVLDFYFNLCSIELTCEELCDLFLFQANHGMRIYDQTKVLTSSQAKRINALMQTCGFYDESGEFAFKVGLPGKSGVGGAIIAIHPSQYAIAVWSPKLNKKGNSFKGMKFLEDFTTRTEFSIF